MAMNPDRISQAWLDAIDDATSCLRGGRGGYDNRNDDGSSSYTSNSISTTGNESEFEYSLGYLSKLEDTLLNDEILAGGTNDGSTVTSNITYNDIDTNDGDDIHASNNTANNGVNVKWSQSPSHDPPTYGYRVGNRRTNNNSNEATNSFLIPSAVIQNNTNGGRNNTNRNNNKYSNNPYAAAFDDSDDAGDQPTMNHHNHVTSTASNGMAILTNTSSNGSPVRMDRRRLLIRIITCQSEIHAALGGLYVNNNNRRSNGYGKPRWMDAALQYSRAVQRIHDALMLADTQVSLLIAESEQENGDDANQNDLKQQQRTAKILAYTEDAMIVEVAIQSLTSLRDKYVTLASQQMQYLKQQLEPQWKSRDDVKGKIGTNRWKNNPAPSNHYANLRRDHEAELRMIQKSIQHLSELGNIDHVIQTSQEIQNKLQGMNNNGNNSNNNALLQSKRDNGVRPELEQHDYWQKRVSLEEYPDPRDFGWTFTGSCVESFVEFYQKDVPQEQPNSTTTIIVTVKLDWYYTTATMKTSMYHVSREVKTQLFGKRMSSEDYIAILLDPRHHTGHRYHPKPNTNKSNKNRSKNYNRN